MEFEDMKKKQLAKRDISSIGCWDEKILGLCNKLNKKKNYYTTSSCSGRIVLIKGEIDKQKDVFLYRNHEKVSLKELKKALENIEYDGLVEFKQSPCILHVACRNLGDADELVRKAKLAGWKHSGIMAIGKRIMVELHSTEHMDFPIMNNKEVLVDDKFLEIAVREANLRLERAWKKIEKLKKMI